MTSAEKVAELRRAMTAAAAAGDPALSSLFGTWRIVRPLTSRFLARIGLTEELLVDTEALDELAGLIAGVALELRSDPHEVDEGAHPVAFCVCESCANAYVDLRVQARELLDRVTEVAGQ